MYIYELPFDINKELCRLLDNEDYWKELAGDYMSYSAFDINEIEQTAKRQAMSPTNQLFIRWGQLNHTVKELFMLLYRMKHIPALRCLLPVVDNRFHDLLKKHESRNGLKERKTVLLDVNANKQSTQRATLNSIPLPVLLIGKGSTSSKVKTEVSPAFESSTDTSKDKSSQNYNDDDEFMKNVSAIPRMSYEDLRAATDNWSNNNLLGSGGFGWVYKGVWKHLPVAVKKLQDNSGSTKELIREMCPNKYRHDNILPLYGYSFGGPEACLVYQLMAGGSLDQRLRGKTQHPPLTWSQRYRIAHGVARGLQYLHTMEGTPLIHGDIKPANILLDQCLMPKIGDFGLARKAAFGEDRTHFKVSRVCGTKPYLPDEYLRSNYLSPAVDVFSYGVVIVEMATTLLALDSNRPIKMLSAFIHFQEQEGVDLATLEDPLLRNTANSNPHLCREFISIGLHCTKFKKQERPTMLEVYKTLDAMDLPGKYFI